MLRAFDDACGGRTRIGGEKVLSRMLKATIVDWHRVMWELMKLEIDVKVVCKAFPLWHVSWETRRALLGGIWPKACEDGGVKMKQDAMT